MNKIGPLKTWLKRFPRLRKQLRTVKLTLRAITNGRRLLVGSRNARAFKDWGDYFTAQPIAGYVGWLGHANLGDEALYVGFRQLFPQFQIISANDVHPLELILYRHLVKPDRFYDFVFLGGGTLINARKYLDALQNPRLRENSLVVFGTGVRDPSFWTPHYPPAYARDMAAWVALLQKAAFVGVRGPQSAAILAAYGLPKARVIGDPALSLCRPRPSDRPRSRTIALNLGCSGPMWGRQQQLDEVIGRLAQRLLKVGWRVEFLPMHPTDLRLARRIIQTFDLPQVSIWPHFQNVDKTLARIRSYDLVIGQRLHAAVLACGSGVPAISLAYRPKCSDFMESIGMQPFAVRTDRVAVDRLEALIDEINLNYSVHCRQLNATCNHLRLLQRQAAEEVARRVSGLGRSQ